MAVNVVENANVKKSSKKCLNKSDSGKWSNRKKKKSKKEEKAKK